MQKQTKKISIPKKEFIKEHKQIPKILTKGTAKQRAIEAKKQTKELKAKV